MDVQLWLYSSVHKESFALWISRKSVQIVGIEVIRCICFYAEMYMLLFKWLFYRFQKIRKGFVIRHKVVAYC